MPRVSRRAIVDLGSSKLSEGLRARLAPPVRHPHGYLIVEGFAARTGIQLYLSEDGASVIREYRPPEEVFNAESLASWEGIPFTPRHPKNNLTSADAASKTRGAVLSASALTDVGWVKTRIAVHDQALIEAIASGELSELSAGYEALRVEESGIAPDGERYDTVQREIRLNHLAAVDMARAGRSARIRLDAAGEMLLDADDNDTRGDDPAPQGAPLMAKLKIKGVEYEVADAVAPIIQAELDAHTQTRNAADAAQARLDAMTAEMEALKNQTPDVDGLVAARLALLAKARDAAPKAKLDGLATERAIKEVVVKDRLPTLDLKDKSDAYVDAAFDAACASKPNPSAPRVAAAGGEQPLSNPSTGVVDAAAGAGKDRAKPPKSQADAAADAGRAQFDAYGKMWGAAPSEA